MTHPLQIYAEGLLSAGQPEMVAQVRLRDGTVVPLALERYVGPADETDREILQRLQGPVLDVGCGPGRHLHALARRGVFALGVDLSPIAVGLARGGGGRAIVASIFDELPGAGTWRSALLLDGNIGIGGAPERLLARVRALLAQEASLLVELEPPSIRTTVTSARLETTHGTSAWFPWARVADQDIVSVARRGGFTVAERWTRQERWFASLIAAAPVPARTAPTPAQGRIRAASARTRVRAAT